MRLSAKQRANVTKRVFKNGFLNLIRNLWLTSAATLVMFVSLLMISLSIVLNIAAHNAQKVIAEDLKATVYLKEDIGQVESANLINVLKKDSRFTNVEFIDSKTAESELLQDFPNDAKLQEAIRSIEGQVFKNSIRVSSPKLEDLNALEGIVNADSNKDIVEKLSLGQKNAKKTITTAASTQKTITYGSVIVVSVLILICVMIIFNTIRMAIFSRKEEIRIMKLIGATPGYIKSPFVIESTLYGVIAGVLSTAATFSIIASAGEKVKTQRIFADSYVVLSDTRNLMYLGFGLILIGMLIGIISSSLAMKKHLRLKDW